MSKDTISYLDISLIRPNPYQPRKIFSDKELEELAMSIEQQGLLQPIVVCEKVDETGTFYELVAGERRLRAVRDILTRPRIKAIISKEITTIGHQEEAALVENIQRSDLNPMEEARAIQAIMDREGLTQEQVSKRIGKPRSEVSNLIRLLRLPLDVQDLVAQGKLEKTKGWKLAILQDEKKMTELAHRAISGNWNFEKVRAEVDKTANKVTGQKRTAVPVDESTNQTIGELDTTVSTTTANLAAPPAKAKPVDLSRFVLVEFEPEDKEVRNQFMADLIEQGYKCYTESDIQPALKNKLVEKPDQLTKGFFPADEKFDEPLELADS